MRNKSQFKIIPTIEEDAPFGDVNYCTMSFFSSDKVDKTKVLNIKAFKIHNGYNNFEIADTDAKDIKKKMPNHDIYALNLGKLYPWDDATRSDAIEYDDEKLNELEKTRKENIDKIKLMNQQFKNEQKTVYANVNNEKLKDQKRRLREKLYEQGKITKQEYDMLVDEDKTVNQVKDVLSEIDKLRDEIEEANKHDYLDENPSVGLKFGCISLYSPKNIKNIDGLYFKVRGLFQTQNQLAKRVRELEKLYPHDKIYTFEVGKWSVYSDNNLDHDLLLKQLNYCMKCYLDNLVNEREEFEKRKQRLQENTEQESKIVKLRNRQEKRRAKREEAKKAKQGKSSNTSGTTTSASTSLSSNDNTNTSDNRTDTIISDKPKFVGNEEDNIAIQNIYDYINDPELANRFDYDKSQCQTTRVDVN
ncbi:hypothetical protein CE11_00480 [Megavirus courdo11]|uniref:Uncharacterized protein n=1 Tax=Megavirus courdo11 TaxID=1128140 RepID=K7YF00_9VIRU|nr:hypothetical protein CE11_00480 [Megavirus courdo11]